MTPWPDLDFDFKPGDVHVWAIALDMKPKVLARIASVLNAAELEQGRRFRFVHHRDRFIAGRCAIRILLGHYLKLKPQKLTFAYGSAGKPFLTSSALDRHVHFNFTHSDNVALLAVTRTEPVGIDIERLDSLNDLDAIMTQVASPEERHRFCGLEGMEKRVAFFKLWTRKEAWLKATGNGITQLLTSVEVTFLPGEPARLIRVPIGSETPSFWRLYDVPTPTGFAGALCIQTEADFLNRRFYDDTTSSHVVMGFSKMLDIAYG